MTRSFQLDQNSDHKRLVKKCNDGGRCIVYRLPPELRDENDPIVLKRLLTADATMLTMDFKIVYQHGEYIPKQNPGLIIVKARPNTDEIMTRLIARFKLYFPQWHETEWNNIYLEIEETEIYVSKLYDGNIDDGSVIRYDAEQFAESLIAYMATVGKSYLGETAT